jgi:hypothetical protein
VSGMINRDLAATRKILNFVCPPSTPAFSGSSAQGRAHINQLLSVVFF